MLNVSRTWSGVECERLAHRALELVARELLA